jgi:RNA 3'-terminal phosphate cyclase-like protein
MATKFTTHAAFTHRIILSTLTGQPVHISQIRSSSPTEPGLAPYEVSFLRLLEAITNGSLIEISYTGTTLLYKPGLITGSVAGLGSAGGVTRFELPANCSRGLSYFLIPICLLAPFSKASFNVIFHGPGVITSATTEGDISVDSVRTAILPIYAHFGLTNNIELRINKRSCCNPDGKGGSGEVQFIFGHQVRLPKTLHFLNPGRIKRIRGVAYCIGVSSSNNARMIESARGVLNPFVKDVYIFSDVSSAPIETSKAGNKQKVGVGYGLSLVAESSTGVVYSADAVVRPTGGEPAEEIGRKCALQLLEEISFGGCVSRSGVSTMITRLAMGSEDVGRLQIGRAVIGSEETIQLGRDLRKLGYNAWGLRDSDTSDDVVLSIVGRGIGNVGRKVA